MTSAVTAFYFYKQILAKISIPNDKNSLIFLIKIILLVNVALVGAKLGDSAQTNWMIFSMVNRFLAAIALILAMSFFIHKIKYFERYRFLILLAIAIFIRIFAVLSAPSPTIDVFYILRDGSKLLLQGGNPYELFYPAPYGVYIPNIVFHYGPLTPFLFSPSVFMFNDPRPTLILAEIGSAFLIYMIAKKRNLDENIAMLLVLIFMFHPVFSFMVEHSWPDTLITFLFLLAIYFVNQTKRSLVPGFALGSILAIKSVYFLPLFTFLVSTKSRMSNILIMFSIPVVLSLPFLYADPKLFWERTQIYVTNPERLATVLAPTNISLSISAVILKYTKIVLPSYIAAIPAFLMAALLLVKNPKIFAFSLLSTFLVFMFLFMFGPYAFLYNFAMMGNILLFSLLFLIPGRD
ncbi:MAG: hypothetical protein Q7S45_04420 [Candidatus Curtissbacteria bacterium]|nr:hypothetical protein [Candidatus Curtissbacteria bacterium]